MIFFFFFQELTDKRLNVAVNLNQDVGHLKKLLVSVSQMLSKGREHYQLVGGCAGLGCCPVMMVALGLGLMRQVLKPEASHLEAFKARLDVAPGSLVCWLVTLHIAGGWNWMSIVLLFNPGHCRIL